MSPSRAGMAAKATPLALTSSARKATTSAGDGRRNMIVLPVGSSPSIGQAAHGPLTARGGRHQRTRATTSVHTPCMGLLRGFRVTTLAGWVAALVIALFAVSTAFAQVERPSFFPD